MKRKYRISILSLVLGSVMFLGQGCEKWLDLSDYSKIPYDEFWQTKEDVDGMVSGVYTRLRSSITKLFYWAELRGDCIERNTSFTGDQSWRDDIDEVKQLEIKPDNTFANYAEIYEVINRCNQIIDYAPGVLELDETFDRDQCYHLIAEMKYIRCLCYFYLVRAFRDVPYVTQSYMDDTRDFNVPKTEMAVILQKLVEELTDLVRPKTDTDPGGDLLPVQPSDYPWSTKGRASVYAAYALLADIYLWQEDYDNAIKYCDFIINSGMYPLVETFTGKNDDGTLTGVNNNAWFNQLFGTGNSQESIFELQWSGTQVNGLFEILVKKNDESNVRLRVPNSVGSETSGKLFGTSSGQVRNVRGVGRSINSDLRMWKYATKSAGGSVRGDSERNANFIVYRSTEAYLMKAEALIMKEEGNMDNYIAAYELINMIRERGGFDTPEPQFTNEQAGLEYLLLERQREFLGEGKRWFDLVRAAMKRDGLYKDILIDLLVVDIAADIRDVYRSKLQDPYGYFMPIHEREIEASGGIVQQNPYYN